MTSFVGFMLCVFFSACTNIRSVTPKQAVPLGGKAEFYCKPLFASPGILWKKEGSSTVLSTTRTLTIDPVKKASAGKYYCEVSTSFCVERRNASLEALYSEFSLYFTLTPGAGVQCCTYCSKCRLCFCGNNVQQKLT